MKMNGKKTKTMLVSKDVTSTKVSVKIDGDIIDQTIPIWDKRYHQMENVMMKS